MAQADDPCISVHKMNRAELESQLVALQKTKPIPEELVMLFTNINKMRKNWKGCVVDVNDYIVNTTKSPASDRVTEIDYSNASVRTYYITKFMPGFTEVFFSYLNEMYDNEESYRKWIEKKRLERGKLLVVSIGGGPGTELFALDAHFRFVQKDILENPLQLGESVVLDKYAKSWGDHFEILNSMTEGISLLSNVAFEEIDLNDENHDVQNYLKRADIVTISKVFSSIRSYMNDVKENVEKKLTKIFSTMRPGSLLLFMDSRGEGLRALSVRSAAAGSMLGLPYESKTSFLLSETSCDGKESIPASHEYFLKFEKL